MARSLHIYLVTLARAPMSAFTVKHECASYMNRWVEPWPGNLRVLRMRDGDQPNNPVDITDEMK